MRKPDQRNDSTGLSHFSVTNGYPQMALLKPLN